MSIEGAAPRPSAKIYDVLAKHQIEEEWSGRELIVELRHWATRFIVEFKLDIPEVVLCLDRLPSKCFGHFRPGHNGLGLKGEIAINTLYVRRRPLWEILGTLLHELLHAWQQAHGKPGKRNHHNAEFREKAEELGLLIDRSGVTTYASWSPFKEVLRRFAVEVPDAQSAPSIQRPKSKSKLKKWSCACTNIRVAVSDFRARCLKCGHEFQPAESGGGELSERQ